MTDKDDKPALLQAIELVLTDPAEIRKESLSLQKEFYNKYSNSKATDEINALIVDKIISKYSYYAAFSGGTTALSGIIPGLGTAVTLFGGAVVDTAACMKFQIEMTMAIATIYGHNIEVEEEKRMCFIVAGLGAVNEAAKEGGKKLGSKAFIKMAQQYLKGSYLVAVKEIFKKVGVTFTRKALEKAIPFGIGVIVGLSANKALTIYVGNKAKDFFDV